MKRLWKNIIASAVIVILLGAMVFTLIPKNNNFRGIKNGKQQMQMRNNGNKNRKRKAMGQPPQDGNNQMNQQPQQDGNNSMNKPPQDGNNQMSQPQQDGNNQMNQPSQDGNDRMNQPPQDGNNQMSQPPLIKNKAHNSPLFYIALFLEGLGIAMAIMYLVLTKGSKKGFKETFSSKKKLIATIVISVLAGCLLLGIGGICNMNRGPIGNGPQMKRIAATSSAASGGIEVNTKKTLTGNYTTNKKNTNTILVKSNGNAIIKNSKIKKSGETTNVESADFYGLNSAVLGQSNSITQISDSTISTSAKGAGAVFSTGENSKIYISNTKINTTGESSSRGLDATYKGYIEAENVTINTKGGSSAGLATDRGEGTVKANKSSVTTNGAGSPIIYSTGKIILSDSNGRANGSQMVVVEGKNTASVIDSKLIAKGKGNRGNVDNCGVMIYQSMSGDADEGEGVFNVKNSTLEIDKKSQYYKTAPMFFSTNTKATINIENTNINYGSNILLKATKTDEWGENNNNGAEVTINAKEQKLSGDILADELSKVTLNLKKSTYVGGINNNKKAKEIVLKLDKNSKIKLTKDSYVTSIDNENGGYKNIDFNGYKLYVNGKEIKNK